MAIHSQVDQLELAEFMGKLMRQGFEPVREEQPDGSVWTYLIDTATDRTVLAGVARESYPFAPVRDVQVDETVLGKAGLKLLAKLAV